MNIAFENFSRFNILSEQEIQDLADVFSRDENMDLTVRGDMPPKRKSLRGLHSFDSTTKKHVIFLSKEEITRAFKERSRCGGNSVPKSLKMAAAMVMVHELEHGNQVVSHGLNEKFYTHRNYMSRPCERGARSFVDDNMKIIEAIIGENDETRS